MKLQILVSTMNQEDYDLINKMNIESNAVIINQCNDNLIKDINIADYKIKWISSNEKGLSSSRNMALNNAEAEICVIADDDLEYVSNYEDIILEQFRKNPNYDIITFQVEGIERKFKDYYNKPRNTNYITSMKVSSVEIAFRLDAIREAGVEFNELFGSGAKYFAGEENIFLTECLRKGLRLKYVPIKIANLHIGESTWFKGYNTDYFVTKGAVFTAMSRLFSVPLILQFAFRKYGIYSNEMSIMQAIKLMLKGRKQFLVENKTNMN